MLRTRLAPKVQATISAAAGNIERRGITTNDFGTLPRAVAQVRGGYEVTVYPALADEGDSVAVRVFETEAEQRQAMRAGTRRLLLLTLPPAARFLQGRLDNRAKLELSRATRTARSPTCWTTAPARPWTGWSPTRAGRPGTRRRSPRCARRSGPTWWTRSPPWSTQVRAVLATRVRRRAAAGGTRDPALLPALADIRQQLRPAGPPGVRDRDRLAAAAPPAALPAGDRAPAGPAARHAGPGPAADGPDARDRAGVPRAAGRLPAGGPADEGLREIRWMIEELRVNFFAQALGTAYPVSDKRIYKAMDQLPD